MWGSRILGLKDFRVKGFQGQRILGLKQGIEKTPQVQATGYQEDPSWRTPGASHLKFRVRHEGSP